ncbi:MAG: TonB-dependent receptor plug domain-containing protein [Gemmatimonadales bacterium]
MNAALLALAFVVQDTVVLKPVVVTATRLPVPVDIVASAVTVISGAELRAQGVRSVAEALRHVPGVAVVETGSFGGQTSLFLRGGESDYVKVLLDGVPLNQAGGGLDLADLTTDNVDRIEVVRGPASVLYGSDAMTGVIQIFTRTGEGAPRVEAELRAGTYGTTEGAIEIGGGAGAVSYSARASRFGSDGLYAHNNQYRNTVVSARVRVAPDARTDASLSYRYGDDVYHFPTDEKGLPADSNKFGGERGPTLSLAVGRVLGGGGLEARVEGSLREARLMFIDDPDSPAEDGAFWSRDYVRRARGGVLLTWRPRGAALTAGVDYEDERQRGRSVFSASYGTFPDSIAVRRWTAGYYAQGLLGTTGSVAVTLGARVDDNSQFGGHATFRAGATWRLDANTRLRATVGTGFKEPTFFENFASGFVRGNPNLDPERSRSWEAGLEHTIPGGRLSFAVTYFDQRFRDLIEFTLTPPPPDSVNYFNVEGASADGVEAAVSATVTPGVAVDVRYTYLDTRVEEAGLDGGADGLFVTGQRLLRRPAHTVAPQLAAALGARARVTVGARWVGERDDLDFARPAGDRRVTLPAYTRVYLAAEYDLRRPGLVLTARLENAFNDGASEISGFRSRGRTVLVGGRVARGP